MLNSHTSIINVVYVYLIFYSLSKNIKDNIVNSYWIQLLNIPSYRPTYELQYNFA